MDSSFIFKSVEIKANLKHEKLLYKPYPTNAFSTNLGWLSIASITIKCNEAVEEDVYTIRSNTISPCL